MTTEHEYRIRYREIAELLHNTKMTYAEIGRKFGLTKQFSQQLLSILIDGRTCPISC